MSKGIGLRRFYLNLKDEEAQQHLQQDGTEDLDVPNVHGNVRSGRHSMSPALEDFNRFHDRCSSARSSVHQSRRTSPTTAEHPLHAGVGDGLTSNAYTAALNAVARASLASAALDPKDLFIPHVSTFRFSAASSPTEGETAIGASSGSRSSAVVFADRNRPQAGDPRRGIYLLMEDPSSSKQAFFISMFVSFMIAVSAVLTTVETMPTFRGRSTPEIWFFLETTIVIVFSVEYILRAYAHSQTIRHFFRFCFSFLGIIDALSVFPYAFELAFKKGETTYEFRFTILRLFRLFRVFRAFKYSSLIQMSIEVMIVALKMSTDALLALFFFSGIVIVTFSSFLYFAERGTWDEDKKAFLTPSGGISLFDSIPSSFWFVVVTITTTGYGDMVPETFVGKLVAFPLMICGILLVALPSIIVGRNFTVVWEATKHYRTSQTENIHDVFPHHEDAYELESVAAASDEHSLRTSSRQESRQSRRKPPSEELSAAENNRIAALAEQIQSLQTSHQAILHTLGNLLERLERTDVGGGRAGSPVRQRSPVRHAPNDT